MSDDKSGEAGKSEAGISPEDSPLVMLVESHELIIEQWKTVITSVANDLGYAPRFRIVKMKEPGEAMYALLDEAENHGCLALLAANLGIAKRDRLEMFGLAHDAFPYAGILALDRTKNEGGELLGAYDTLDDETKALLGPRIDDPTFEFSHYEFPSEFEQRHITDGVWEMSIAYTVFGPLLSRIFNRFTYRLQRWKEGRLEKRPWERAERAERAYSDAEESAPQEEPALQGPEQEQAEKPLAEPEDDSQAPAGTETIENLGNTVQQLMEQYGIGERKPTVELRVPAQENDTGSAEEPVDAPEEEPPYVLIVHHSEEGVMRFSETLESLDLEKKAKLCSYNAPYDPETPPGVPTTYRAMDDLMFELAQFLAEFESMAAVVCSLDAAIWKNFDMLEMIRKASPQTTVIVACDQEEYDRLPRKTKEGLGGVKYGLRADSRPTLIFKRTLADRVCSESYLQDSGRLLVEQAITTYFTGGPEWNGEDILHDTPRPKEGPYHSTPAAEDPQPLEAGYDSWAVKDTAEPVEEDAAEQGSMKNVRPEQSSGDAFSSIGPRKIATPTKNIVGYSGRRDQDTIRDLKPPKMDKD